LPQEFRAKSQYKYSYCIF